MSLVANLQRSLVLVTRVKNRGLLDLLVWGPCILVLDQGQCCSYMEVWRLQHTELLTVAVLVNNRAAHVAVVVARSTSCSPACWLCPRLRSNCSPARVAVHAAALQSVVAGNCVRGITLII